jgi:hypothetical protein
VLNLNFLKGEKLVRNNNFGAVAALVFVLFTATNVANAGEYFVKGLLGPTWYQSDSNSNHHAYAQSGEVGYRFTAPINIVANYLQSENQDGGVSQNVDNGPYEHLSYDFDYKTAVVYVMPRFDYGRLSFSAGPGYGTAYSTLDLNMDNGESESSTYWQDNVSLRADLDFKVTKSFAVGATYRHDYFEVQLDDRQVSDYEVNQDRVYYMVSGSWTF